MHFALWDIIFHAVCCYMLHIWSSGYSTHTAVVVCYSSQPKSPKTKSNCTFLTADRDYGRSGLLMMWLSVNSFCQKRASAKDVLTPPTGAHVPKPLKHLHPSYTRAMLNHNSKTVDQVYKRQIISFHFYCETFITLLYVCITAL